MSNPLVSFFITSHNKGPWLADCLWSAFSQSYKPIEVILCDNGSTDETKDIINSFIKVPNFITLIYKEPLRMPVAFNKCLDASHGEWFVKLDADDIVSPEHVEDLIREAKEADADMVFGDFIKGLGEEIDQNVPTNIERIFKSCSIGLCSAIVKKSACEDVGRFDESMTFSEDWEFIIRMIKSGKKVIKGKKTGYVWRIIDRKASTLIATESSEERVRNHKYIREKHNLVGPCECGCNAEGMPYPIIEGQTISVSMIVKDEEIVLEDCLKSISGADEIVILDTGSTDGTPAISKKYTPKYIEGEYKWNDNFAEARNESLKRCTGDWILIIDADERLEDNGIQRIRNLVRGISPDILAVGFDTISANKLLKHESVRLFRNHKGIVWHGAVHNYLSARSQLSSGISLYYGYSPAHDKDPDRAMRILTREVEKDPNCLRERFYLAREYFYRKKWEEAVEHYKIYLEKAHWAPEMAEAWMQVCRCYANVGMIFEARLACLRAIEINVDFKDALNVMAHLSPEPAASRWREYAAIAKNSGTLFSMVENN